MTKQFLLTVMSAGLTFAQQKPLTTNAGVPVGEIPLAVLANDAGFGTAGAEEQQRCGEHERADGRFIHRGRRIAGSRLL